MWVSIDELSIYMKGLSWLDYVFKWLPLSFQNNAHLLGLRQPLIGRPSIAEFQLVSHDSIIDDIVPILAVILLLALIPHQVRSLGMPMLLVDLVNVILSSVLLLPNCFDQARVLHLRFIVSNHVA